jgi:hypothetical protein
MLFKVSISHTKKIFIDPQIMIAMTKHTIKQVMKLHQKNSLG